MIVGVAGRNGSGKGEVIKLLEARGYRSLSLSDVIRDALGLQGLEPTRERMIETGRAMRAEGGPGTLGERLLVKMDPDRDYAIDSVRHPAEVDALRAGGRHFILLWVNAGEGVRLERMKARGRVGDPQTLDRMRSLESQELGNADPTATQLDAVRQLADRVLDNDRGLDALSTELERALAETAS